MRMRDVERQLLAQGALSLDEGITELSKRMKRPRHQVQYALDMLLERGWAKKLWVIDIFRLGWQRFNVLFVTAARSSKNREKFVQTLCESSNVSYLGELTGDFEFEMTMLASNSSEILRFLHETSDQFGGVFLRKDVSTRSYVGRFPRKYLYPTRGRHLSLDYQMTNEVVEIDELDHQVLRLMSLDASLSVREIARKLERPISTVEVRVARLKREKVIQGAVLTTRPANYGALGMKLLLYFRGFNASVRERIYEFAKCHKNCTYYIECFGSWDYELGVEAEDFSQVAALKQELKEEFVDFLVEIKTLNRFTIHKNETYPVLDWRFYDRRTSLS